MIGGNGLNSPKVGEIAGDAADGTLVGSPWFIGKADPVNQAFVAAYRAKYGSDPDQFAAQAYDTLKLVAKAITAAGAADPEKIRDALPKTSHEGVMGKLSFNAERSPADTSGVAVLEMKGGKFQIFKQCKQSRSIRASRVTPGRSPSERERAGCDPRRRELPAFPRPRERVG